MQGWLHDESTEVSQERSENKLYCLNTPAGSVKSSDHLVVFQLVSFGMLKHLLTETWPGSFKRNTMRKVFLFQQRFAADEGMFELKVFKDIWCDHFFVIMI